MSDEVVMGDVFYCALEGRTKSNRCKIQGGTFRLLRVTLPTGRHG